MKNSNPYLFFNQGKCKAAMEFYQRTFGGELKLMMARDAGPNLPPGMDPNLVMHGMLQTPGLQLMASDNGKGDTQAGDNVCIYLDCANPGEVDQLFTALSAGGETHMAPTKTFWGAYFGSLTDSFGTCWMLSASL